MTDRNTRTVTSFSVTHKDERGREFQYSVCQDWRGGPPTANELKETLRYLQSAQYVIRSTEEVDK